MFVRDTNMSADLAKKYEVGKILRDRVFTDATCRVGGLVTSHRVSILSNHMPNLGDLVGENESAAQFGLCVAQHGSRFKVLDNFEIDGKTQILLLHLPNDENWKLFQSLTLDVEDELIKESREYFLHKKDTRPIPEVNSEEWYERLTFPLGFDEKLEPWPLDDSIEKRMKPLRELDFREVAGRVLYIKDMYRLLHLEEFNTNLPSNLSDYPDSIVYGYIDKDAGLSMRVLCAARLCDSKLEYLDAFHEVMLIIRAGGAKENFVAQIVDTTLSDYADLITSVEETYNDNEAKEETRKLGFLDNFRHEDYPDDIQAILVTQNEVNGYEQVWMRLEFIKESTIYAKLLNEPAQKSFKVHAGAILPLWPREDENNLTLFALADDAL